MARFQSTKTTEEYKQKSKNANTTKATTQWMRVLYQQAQKSDYPQNTEVLAPDTLDSILQHFFAETNKKDGKDYEPRGSLLREKGLGKKSNKTNSLTRQEEDKPWECGQLGDKTRKSIIATPW